MSSSRPLFGGDLRDVHERRQSAQQSPNIPPPPQGMNTSPEYQGWAQPVALENLSLDFTRPTFRDAYMQAESEPHTPSEQLPPAVSEFTMLRFGSVSSIATTDDDEPVNEIQYPWTDQQDLLVRSMYEDVVNDPQTAPFSGRYPPSGVVHRVAKDTMRMAKHRNVYFPHSMNAVRHRIIKLFHSEPDDVTMPEQYRVAPDYFSMAAVAQQASSSPADEFDFTDAIGPRRHSIEEKWAASSSLRPGVANTGQSLAPPFNLTQEPEVSAVANQMGLSEEEVVNIVAKRKRDSLRMKRGLR